MFVMILNGEIAWKTTTPYGSSSMYLGDSIVTKHGEFIPLCRLAYNAIPLVEELKTPLRGKLKNAGDKTVMGLLVEPDNTTHMIWAISATKITIDRLPTWSKSFHCLADDINELDTFNMLAYCNKDNPDYKIKDLLEYALQVNPTLFKIQEIVTRVIPPVITKN